MIVQLFAAALSNSRLAALLPAFSHSPGEPFQDPFNRFRHFGFRPGLARTTKELSSTTSSTRALLCLPVLSYRIRFPSLAYLGVCYRKRESGSSKGSSKPAQPLHGHIPLSDAFRVVACALRYPDPVLLCFL